MKSFTILFALLAIFATPLHAAEGDTYGSVQYALVTYDEEGFDEVEPTALVFKYGKFINDNVSIEGRFGIGLQDDDIDVDILGMTFEAEVEIETVFGVYLVAHTNPDAQGTFYGVLGVTQGELKVSIDGFSDSESESDISYGFGARFGNFTLEYMNYLDKDAFEATAISLGYVF